LHAVHANVALALLFGIVKRMRVKEGPDELAANVFEAKFEMRVLVHGVVATEKCAGANVEALLVGDFFTADETGRVTGARGGDGGVEGMSEGVAESDARRRAFDELCRVSAVKHARLSGHLLTQGLKQTRQH
jgi:hypothetical protein